MHEFIELTVALPFRHAALLLAALIVDGRIIFPLKLAFCTLPYIQGLLF
jgi:hypothetical protein